MDSIFECMVLPDWLRIFTQLVSPKGVFSLGTQVDIEQANSMIGHRMTQLQTSYTSELQARTLSSSTAGVSTASLDTATTPGRTVHKVPNFVLLSPCYGLIPGDIVPSASRNAVHQQLAFICEGRADPGGVSWSAYEQAKALKQTVDYMLLAGAAGPVVYGLLVRGRTMCRIAIIDERTIEIDASKYNFLPGEEMTMETYSSRFNLDRNGLPGVKLTSTDFTDDVGTTWDSMDGLRTFFSQVLKTAHDALRDRTPQRLQPVMPVRGWVRIRITDYLRPRAEWEAMKLAAAAKKLIDSQVPPGKKAKKAKSASGSSSHMGGASNSATRLDVTVQDATDNVDVPAKAVQYAVSDVPDDEGAGDLMQRLVRNKAMSSEGCWQSGAGLYAD